MNVLIITHYFEPDAGAAAVRLSRLTKLLCARGHNIIVLTTMPHYPVGKITDSYRGKWVIRENRDGVNVIRCWLWTTTSPRISRKLISQLSFMLMAMLWGIGLKRPDVLLIEAQPIFTGQAGRFISFIKRAPYVLNVSDLWPDHLLTVGAVTETHPVYRLARRVVDGLYHRAAGIAAMSPMWAEKIAGYIGQSEKIRIIYNGVDLQRFRPDLDIWTFRAKYTLGSGKLITFIGTFATQYDFDAMLDVAGHFRARSDVEFIFIGAGSQHEQVVARIRDSDLPDVKVIDWIDFEDIPQAWNISYLTYWVMRDEPLYQGTIPAKLYEALACGVPIVAGIAGEGARIIEDSDGGIAVDPTHRESLVEAIAQLLDNPAKREHYSQAGRAYAEAHFDPHIVAEQYEAMLKRAVTTTN